MLLLLDALTLAAALAASYYCEPFIQNRLFSQSETQQAPLNTYLWLLVVIVPAWVLILHLNGRYLFLICDTSALAFAWNVVKTGIISTALLALYLFATRNPVSRILVATDGLLSTLFLFFEKAAARRLIRYRQRKGWGLRNILLIGADFAAASILRRIRRDQHPELAVWGCLANTQGEAGEELEGVQIRGAIADYRKLIWKSPVDEILISPAAAAAHLTEIVRYCETIGLTARIIPEYQFSDRALGDRFNVEDFLGRPTLTIAPPAPRVGMLLIKRLIDIVLSALLLVVLAPLMAAIAAAIKATSPGPILYRWRVIGRGIVPFTSYKFRTMVTGADNLKSGLAEFNEMTGPAFKMHNDPRITPLGRILRKYSLDELPQLWSVLKGDLSLVGPRPPGPHEFERFEIWHRRKLSIKPGMTCLWQVSGRNQIADFDDWVNLDLQYIDNWSLWLDLVILARTAGTVLRGTGV
ncbi:MAG: sugar transferase [Candidatus Binataceae bacterium]